MQWGWIALLLIAAAVIGVVVFYRRAGEGRPGVKAETRDLSVSTPPIATSVPPVAVAIPDTLVIGETPDRPLMAVKASADLAFFEGSRSEPMPVNALSRLSSVLQAAPSLLVASESAGKRLMEVVINGELTPASGGGMRAFAMEGGKIVEQGRLFDPGKLQTMINGAAVWQVASVLVAQKHLADISQKLSEIKASLDRVSEFMKSERRGKIKGTYDYLSQVARAIQEGQLSQDVRSQLESCERELLAIQNHLFEEFREALKRRVEHKETVGTEDLTSGIKSKIDSLSGIAADMELCLRTRIGAWHVLSVYPGETALINVRRSDIQKSCDEMYQLTNSLDIELEAEILDVKSRLNFGSTLERRRSMLREHRNGARTSIALKASETIGAIEGSMQALLLQHQPTRILLEVDGAHIVSARQAISIR